MTPDIEHWWGRAGTAHYVDPLSEMRTACGRSLLHKGHDFTRFDPETGEPWAKCEQCLTARRARSAKVAAPPSSDDTTEKKT